ncbi:General substrate transporter [Niveomyces insectorum RCEF 264]|uniref:General substrate transporter n=1 Tax=Niveomyces insectorum RCEF 264 TaxID=1081102 RepID=A0A162J6S7_9HYPO|nr:General substrate transporter [Niveomyces insectorum RCEF 264]
MFGFGSKRPYFGLTGGWLTVWLTIACATDMTLFGYDQAVFSGVVVTDDFLKLHDLVGPSRTKVLSTVVAIYDVGCFLGAVAAFTIGERMGRKKSVLLGTVIMSIGAILQASSFSLGQMFVGRTILGIGNGINTSTAPIWQTETAQPKWRGKLVILEMSMNIAGFCLCNWLNFGVSFVGGSFAWRFPLAFQFVFIFILFATVPWLPESPRWLLAHGHTDEATEVLAALENKPTNDPFVVTERKEIEYSVQYEREHGMDWRQIFTKKAGSTKTLRRLLLGAGTQFMQQFGGINIMSYYMPTVLTTYVGVSTEMARLLTGVNATTYLIFASAAVPMVERWGRRWLMLLSTAGQFVSFLVITILLSVADGKPSGSGVSTATIPFFFLFFCSFGGGMLGVPWLYPTEINSLPMRTKGAALATMTNWITNFVIVEITPIGIQNLGWQFWIIWVVFNAVFLPVIYFLYPETSNRSLEDMDYYYRKDPPLLVTSGSEAVSSSEAISVKRPQEYVERENLEVARTVADEKSNGMPEVEHMSGQRALGQCRVQAYDATDYDNPACLCISRDEYTRVIPYPAPREPGMQRWHVFYAKGTDALEHTHEGENGMWECAPLGKGYGRLEVVFTSKSTMLEVVKDDEDKRAWRKTRLRGSIRNSHR